MCSPAQRLDSLLHTISCLSVASNIFLALLLEIGIIKLPSCTCSPICWESALQLKVRQLWVSVAYVETGEVEEIELAELIRDGHLSIGELSACLLTRPLLCIWKGAWVKIKSASQRVRQIYSWHISCACHIYVIRSSLPRQWPPLCS